jgi:hypothetical protein
VFVEGISVSFFKKTEIQKIQNATIILKNIHNLHQYIKGKGKGKAVPLQAWSGLDGSRKLRFRVFMTAAQDGGKGCQPYAPATFTPRKYTCYSFLLEAESTPGP